jgi:hypothetical protein
MWTEGRGRKGGVVNSRRFVLECGHYFFRVKEVKMIIKKKKKGGEKR